MHTHGLEVYARGRRSALAERVMLQNAGATLPRSGNLGYVCCLSSLRSSLRATCAEHIRSLRRLRRTSKLVAANLVINTPSVIKSPFGRISLKRYLSKILAKLLPSSISSVLVSTLIRKVTLLVLIVYVSSLANKSFRKESKSSNLSLLRRCLLLS